MAKTSKQLREQRAPIAVSIRAMADKIHSENRDFNAEERSGWDKANADYNNFTRQIEAAERAEAVEADQAERQEERSLPGRENSNPKTRRAAETVTENDRAMSMQAWARARLGMRVRKEHVAAARRCKLHLGSSALEIPLTRSYIQPGRDLRNTQIRAAQSAVDGTLGGYTVPRGFVARLEAALLQFGGVLNVAEIMRTTDGRPMPWPTANDTSNKGERIGENTAVSELEVSVGSVTFGAYKYSSKMILIPYELLRDSAFNFVEFVGAVAGERLARKANEDFTVGAGHGVCPQGVITAATTGKTAASATAITVDEIIDLEHSVDPAYRMNASFMLHDNVIAVIRKLKDSSGRYLWEESHQVGAPDRLHGYPVQVNQDMASSVAASAKTISFGDHSKYKVREVGSVRLIRLQERYAEKDQQGLIAFMEWDGDLLDAGTHPVKILVQAAS